MRKKKRLVALLMLFALCLCLIPNIYISQAATVTGKTKCNHLFKNSDIASHQYLVLYSRDGKPHVLNSHYTYWEYKGTDGESKYWTNTKKNCAVAKNYIKGAISDTIKEHVSFIDEKKTISSFDYFTTLITNNYVKNGKNFKGYYAVPFRIYGYLEMRCSKCGEITYTKPKAMYTGYYMIKVNSKGNPVFSVNNVVFLGTNNLARADATVTLPEDYLGKIFEKQNWIPLKRYYKNSDWRKR